MTKVKDKDVKQTKKTFNLRSMIKSMEVGKNYIYCDSSLKGDLSCFIEHKGKRYLKMEKLTFDSIGNLETALLYKPEGIVSYKVEELVFDALLLETNGWKISNNVIEVSSNKIIKPIFGILAEMDEMHKTIYFLTEPSEKSKRYLYACEYW